MFLHRVIHFGEILGDQVKCLSPKKLESLIGVSNVVHMNVHALSFYMILISSQWRVLIPSYPSLGKFGLYGKGSFSEKVKNFNSGSLSMSSESTCF